MQAHKFKNIKCIQLLQPLATEHMLREADPCSLMLNKIKIDNHLSKVIYF